MPNFGWSYPAGCSGVPDDDPPCPLCGGWPDHLDADSRCNCPECPECGEYGDPNCIKEHGLKGPGRMTVQDFINHIGCGEKLSENLRAIDRHNLEHVWVVVNGTQLYYHLDRDVIDAHPLATVITHIGAGCIAWDDSDWGYSCERLFASVEDIDIVRAECIGAHAEYTFTRAGELFAEAEHGDECPLCENGTVEVTATSITCRGECGATVNTEGA